MMADRCPRPYSVRHYGIVGHLRKISQFVFLCKISLSYTS